MVQHLDDLLQAPNVYFVYHPRRSAPELRSMVEACRNSSPANVPEVHHKNPKVYVMKGSALRAVLKEQGQNGALFQALLTGAELVKIVAPLPAGGVCLWIPNCGQILELKADAFGITHTNDAVDDHFPDAVRYLKEVREALATGAAKGDMSPQRFFTELDRTTAADLVGELAKEDPQKFTADEIERRKSSLALMRNLLTERLTRRARDSNPGPPRVEGMRSDIDWLSKQFLDVLLACYPNTLAGDASFEKAIERFATGGLRMQLEKSKIWVCQPNSAYYFLLGEFALCLHQMVVDGTLSDKRWTKELALSLARVTVRTQPLYVLAYGVRAQVLKQHGGNPTVDDYRSYDYRENLTKEAVARIGQTRLDFADKGFQELCELSAKHAHDHLPGWKPPDG